MAENQAENQAVEDERNLLHPLSTLHWELCHTWMESVQPTHCAVLHKTMVILDNHKLHISTDNLHSWTTIAPPHEYASLTTYQSKFVLVGGRRPITYNTFHYSDQTTNLLLTSTNGLNWEKLLPAMPNARCNASSISGGSPEVLVVAGGSKSIDDHWLDVVEVLLGKQWTTVDSLPAPLLNIRSAAFCDGNFYFIGEMGSEQQTVYSCSYDSVTESAEGVAIILEWSKMIPPDDTIAIASYSSCLIAVKRDSTITAYSNTIQTWRELASMGAVLVGYSCTLAAGLSTGELVMADQKYVYRGTLLGFSKYEDAYKHFIDSKDVLEFLNLKFMFLGPPRQGKSTTRQRVMKEIVDLNSAKESDMVHGSTGTVECCPSMFIQGKSDSASAKDRSDWTIVQNLADEACLIFHSLKASLETESSIPEAAATSLVGSETKAEVSQASSTVQSRPIEQPPQPKLLHKMVTRIKSLKKTSQSDQAISALPTHGRSAVDSVTSPDYSEIEAIFKKVSQQPKFAEDVNHCIKAFLRLEDTGGQPELMDMLPALTIGPGLYLLFFSYEFKLDEQYKVFYQRDSGETTSPEKSEFTLQEMLLCMLASISCSIASNDSAPPQKTGNSDIGEILESSKSIVYIVGTHKDKVSEEQIALVDDELKRIIENTCFYKNGILQFCSEDKLVVSLDNMGGGAEEIHQLHKLLENAMEKYFKKLKIPAVWLLFSLCLRMRNVRTASMETCLALSNAFNMTPYETEIALWFLHHHAGILMYFPAVSSLKDLVIVDIQVVYDSITYVILGAMSFNTSGQAKAERFKRTGLFTMKDLKSTTDNITRDLIAPDQLVALLEYLHIIAHILFEESLNDVVSIESKYIMPCVLENTSSQELDLFHQESCKSCFVVPLFVYFTCGFTPMGLFPAAIACLISNKSFFFVKEGIKKNMVHFLYGPKEIGVTFISRSTYYEVVVSCDPTFQAIIHLECAALKKEIENTLKKASFRMNYSSYMEYKFAFECCSHEKEHHLGIVYGEEDIPSVMRCAKEPQGVALQNRHLIWYGQEYEKQTVSEVSESGNCLSVFLKMYPKLVVSVEPCVMTVADHCFSGGLISKDVYDQLVQRVDWINIDKTRVLLSSIRTVISCTPTALKKFIIGVLQEIEYCKEIAEKILRQI